MKTRITAVIVDRANYGRLKPLLTAINNDKDFELKIICCGTTVLRRFHKPATDISKRFFVSHCICHEVEGDTPTSSVNSMAMLMPQLTTALRENIPHYVLVIGDRFETLSVVSTAYVLGYCIIHLQGGELSGNIDNAIRHAISKLSHYHVPATKEAKQRLLDMGEVEDSILSVGCPVADMVCDVVKDETLKDTILCIYHPETDKPNGIMVLQLLDQLSKLKRKVIMLWPNIDPGSQSISKMIRRYIDEVKPTWLEMVVNIPPEQYLSTLASVKCCVGNSSSFVRDASFFGTPVVAIGERQQSRMKTDNIRYVATTVELSNLHAIIWEHMERHFQPSHYYGSMGICDRIIRSIKNHIPYMVKLS